MPQLCTKIQKICFGVYDTKGDISTCYINNFKMNFMMFGEYKPGEIGADDVFHTHWLIHVETYRDV